jgi:uncharacterized phage protein gp47/JayE/uncharacterized protein YmfQ (DUF2313 family)
MAFVRPTLSELTGRIQADLSSRLALPGAALRRSVVAVLARVQAAAAHLLHGHLEFLSRQAFPDASELEYLERQASLFGITRAAAQYATGNVDLKGTDGVGITAGTVLQRADGVQYTVLADVYIAGIAATATVQSVTAGLDVNTGDGVALTFVSPIPGITAVGSVAPGGIIGGADEESDDDLRARLIARLRQPPNGGAAADYETWAKAVAGVTRAWVYPLELGAGTVTVRFVRDDDGTGAAIIPSSGEVAAVQAYIDTVRPVTAAVTVVAPTAVTRNFTIHVVPDTAATRAAVQAELEDLLRREAIPGTTLLLSHIRTAIAAAADVTDYTLTVAGGRRDVHDRPDPDHGHDDMDVNAYARQLALLLPPGSAWRLEADTVLSRLLLGMAEEFARIDDRAVVLVDEWDPRTTSEMLGDWERVYGLPDPCLGPDPTVSQRRASLLAKVVGIGGQSIAYFVGLAAALGFTVTVTEFRPFDVTSDVDAPLCGDEWAYAWQVNAPLNTVTDIGADDTVADPLAWWGNAVLECVLLEQKPAHTILLFAYS